MMSMVNLIDPITGKLNQLRWETANFLVNKNKCASKGKKLLFADTFKKLNFNSFFSQRREILSM